MKYLIKPFFVFILFATSMHLRGQQMQTFNAGEAQMLPEIKGIVISENGKLVIGPMPSADQRGKEYQEIDLKSGDEIQFVNGKRVKTIEDFKKNYSEIKVGDEFKLGVKRGEQRFIVALKKSDAKAGPQIIRMGGDGKVISGDAKVENGKVIIGGKKLDLDSLQKAGANIKIKKDKKD